MRTRKGIDIYTTDNVVHLLLTKNVNTEISTFGKVISFERSTIAAEAIRESIGCLLSVTDIKFNEDSDRNDFQILGYPSHLLLYKKTNLITLRIEEQKISIFNAKKVKRWYEFEPIEPVEGYEMDEDGIKRLSTSLVKLLQL